MLFAPSEWAVASALLAISRQSLGGRASEEKVSSENLINWTKAKSAKNSNGEWRNFYKFFYVVFFQSFVLSPIREGRSGWQKCGENFLSFFFSNFRDSAHRRSYMFTQCDQTMKTRKTSEERGKGGENLKMCFRNFQTFQFLILHWKFCPSCCRSGSLLKRKLGNLFEFSEAGKTFLLN